MLALMLLLSWIGYSPDTFALMELNHRYNSRGEEEYTQIIFYDWSSQSRRWDVHGCKLVRPGEVCGVFKDGQLWKAVFFSGLEEDVVMARLFRETHTTYDPETTNKWVFAEHFRRGLRPR